MLLAQLHGLPEREGPRLEAQLTLPLSTISFCRLVDVVTRSRMACQDPDIRHSWGGHPSCRARPPPGPQLAAHLHQVSAGVEDPVGGRKGERGVYSVAPDAAGLVGEQGWPLWTAMGPDTGCLAMWPQKVDEWRSPSFLDS